MLREELLDLFDSPQVEGPLFGPHAPLWRRVRVLGTVEASRPVTQVPGHVLQNAFGDIGVELVTRDLEGL